VALREHQPGTWIFDLGQNISGIVRLKVRGRAGDQVTIRHAEMLHADGRLSTENLRCARATDTYTLKGDPHGETWQPSFTYHGFQFVELTGFPGTPTKDAVTGVVIHSDTPRVGSFECSDPLLNRLYQNIVWTQRANFFEMPTDCPQRDERIGWTGDAQIYVAAATCNADIAAFYTKWLRDLNDDQHEFGAYPSFAPAPFYRPDEWFAAAWMDAGVICPWTIWRVYGDTRVLAEHWPKMEKFMEFRRQRDPQLQGTAERDSNYGDWLALYEPKTPIEFIDLAYHAYDARLMADMAAALGKTDRAGFFRDHHHVLLDRFRALHVNADGTLKIANQTTYALALFFELVPADLRVAAAGHLARLIRDNGNKMSTGFLGTRPLLPVLSATGHHALAGILIQQQEYPGWGYEVANGATTIWERWNSYIKGQGVHEPAMNSFSHYAFGAVCEWLFAELGGLGMLEPGHDVLRIAPRPTGTITHCRVATVTRHGRAACAWQLDGATFRAEITVPPNSSAEVTLPVAGPEAGPRRVGSGTWTFAGRFTP
jgi:alpha-L-rhamnosidase